MTVNARRRFSADTGGWAPPNSISSSDLLEDGSDRAFRGLVEDLVAFAARLQSIREAIAKRMGLTPPQYRVIMVIAHGVDAQGISVRAVADRLHVSVPFVVNEVRRLVAGGLVNKETNPRDRRGVLLTLTQDARSALEAIAPYQRALNDTLFGELSARDFARLRPIAESLVDSAERTLALMNDVSRIRR